MDEALVAQELAHPVAMLDGQRLGRRQEEHRSLALPQQLGGHQRPDRGLAQARWHDDEGVVLDRRGGNVQLVIACLDAPRFEVRMLDEAVPDRERGSLPIFCQATLHPNPRPRGHGRTLAAPVDPGCVPKPRDQPAFWKGEPPVTEPGSTLVFIKCDMNCNLWPEL